MYFLGVYVEWFFWSEFYVKSKLKDRISNKIKNNFDLIFYNIDEQIQHFILHLNLC